MEVIISTNICQFRCRLNIGFYFSPAPWTQQNKEVLWLQTVAAHWSVKCHNKGSCCIQGPVEKLSWLDSSNFITKQRMYLPVRVNSLLSAGIFKKYLITISGRSFNFREACYFDNDYLVCLSTLVYWNLFYVSRVTARVGSRMKVMSFFQRIWLKCMNALFRISRNSNFQTLFATQLEQRVIACILWWMHHQTKKSW